MRTFLAAFGAFLLIIAGGFAFQYLGQIQTPLPEEPAETATTTIEAMIGNEKSALDVTVVPLEVVQDSRCPADLECIWAGTVQVRALLSSGLGEAEQVFELGQPITTEAEMITLIEVSPAPTAGDAILESDYRFVFEIAKR